MNDEIMDSIRGLSLRIRDEAGTYVNLTLHLHESSTTEVAVMICIGKDDDGIHQFDRIAGDDPAQVRDELAQWLTKHRRKAA